MCKSHKVGPTEFDGNKVEHKCTDLIPLLVFAASCLVGIVVGFLGIQSGNPESLLYGKDYTGVTCGSINNNMKGNCPYGKDADCDMTDRLLVTYPRMNDDIMDMLKEGSFPTDPAKMKFFGICRKACPKAKEWVCTHDIISKNKWAENDDGTLGADAVGKLDACKDNNATDLVTSAAWEASGATDKCKSYMQKCWFNSIEKNDVFFRCFASANENVTYGCDNNADGVIEGGVRSKPYSTDEADGCKTMMKTQASQESAQKDYVAEQIQTFAVLVGRYMGDIKNAALVIGVAGVAIALILGFLWLALLRRFAKCFVWTIVFLVLLLHAVITLFFFIKAGIIRNSTGIEDPSLAVDSSSTDVWTAAAYVMLFVTGIQFVMIVYYGKKINRAAIIIKEASNAIAAMPLLVAFPVVPCIMICGLIFWFVYCGAALYTMENLDTSVLSSASINTTAISSVPKSAMKDYLLLFHLFMFLWGNQFIQGVALMTISGAVSMWYFREFNDKDNRSDNDRTLQPRPIWKSLKRTVGYHAGSVALGAFLVALVQLLRAILAYLDRQTKGMQEKNCFLKLIFKCVACILYCFEKCMKFITRSAYVLVALKSKSFCFAAQEVFSILIANTAQIGIVLSINAYLMLLGKLVIDLGCVMVAYGWLSMDPSYSEKSGKSYVSNIFFPLILVAGVAHAVASVFLTVYDMAIETILIDFCVDKKENAETKNYYMGDELKKSMGKLNEAGKGPKSSETQKATAVATGDGEEFS